MNTYMYAATTSHGFNRVTPTASPPEGDTILLPRGWQSNGTRRGILYMHAAGQFAYHVSTWPVPIVLGSYFPLVVVDGGNPSVSSGVTSGPYNWGNDRAISRTGDAYTYLTTTLGATPGKVGIFAGSMGAAHALNWARQNVAYVSCIALNIPVLDLNDIYTNNKGPGQYQANIGGAYGVVYPAPLPNLSTHSPVAFSAGTFNGVPIKIWASDNDTIAANTVAASAFAASGVGNMISVESTGAQGHNTTNLDPWTVFEWMKQYMA